MKVTFVEQGVFAVAEHLRQYKTRYPDTQGVEQVVALELIRMLTIDQDQVASEDILTVLDGLQEATR